jgi:hypothetical protein
VLASRITSSEVGTLDGIASSGYPAGAALDSPTEARSTPFPISSERTKDDFVVGYKRVVIDGANFITQEQAADHNGDARG